MFTCFVNYGINTYFFGFILRAVEAHVQHFFDLSLDHRLERHISSPETEVSHVSEREPPLDMP